MIDPFFPGSAIANRVYSYLLLKWDTARTIGGRVTTNPL